MEELVELLKVSLGNEPLYIALSNVELAVLCQVDSPIYLLAHGLVIVRFY